MTKLILLKSERDFQAFRQSKSYSSQFIRVRVRFSVNQNNPRFGFIIPKKVLPKVVDRNKVKRRIKTFLSRNVGKLRSVDVLIFPQKDLLKRKFVEVEAELGNLFSKAHLWK